eukprot:GILJ01008292.1.p1 GENE.GILJ01008292.1~~GILJ01008292.1.p1  ORF type:complete len:594 (+),score=72.54 GILJ01008292.1:33-1814(+)
MAVAMEFWSGNPAVDIVAGLLLLDETDTSLCTLAVSTPVCPPPTLIPLGVLEEEEKDGWECEHPRAGSSPSFRNITDMVCACQIPLHMSPAEFCQFALPPCSIIAQAVRGMRVLRSGSPKFYFIVMHFATNEGGESFMAQFHGKPFNSLEPDLCIVHRVHEVGIQLADDGLSSQSDIASSRGTVSIDTRISFPAQQYASKDALPPEMCRDGNKYRRLPPQTLFLNPRMPDNQNMHCPVCLDRLLPDRVESEPDQLVAATSSSPAIGSGEGVAEVANVVLTILCGHSFHCMCIDKWMDESCPVCRYNQYPSECSICDDCGASDNLWLCLICGHIGCKQESLGRGHAESHYESTHHSYSMEVQTQRVWNYAAGGYVHRLLQNKSDGKVVETGVQSGDGAGEGSGPFSDRSLQKKLETVCVQYNHLLASELDVQRRYYEDQLSKIDAQQQMELARLQQDERDLEDKCRSMQSLADDLSVGKMELERQVEKLQLQLESISSEYEQLQRANADMIATQEKQKENVVAIKVREDVMNAEFSKRIEDLEQQIRDLQFYIETQRSIEQSPIRSELQEGHMLITESDRGTRHSHSHSHKKKR